MPSRFLEYGITFISSPFPNMRDYLKGLVDDPTITIYNPGSGEFLKLGTPNPDQDDHTISIDNPEYARMVVEMVQSRRQAAKKVLPEVIGAPR